VPTDLALLEGVETYFVRDEHSELPHNSTVIAAVMDLLKRGHTRRLSRDPSSAAGAPLCLTERELRGEDSSKHDWRRMSLVERRRLLEGVVFPMLD
jgi:hypothetical protein